MRNLSGPSSKQNKQFNIKGNKIYTTHYHFKTFKSLDDQTDKYLKALPALTTAGNLVDFRTLRYDIGYFCSKPCVIDVFVPLRHGDYEISVK